MSSNYISYVSKVCQESSLATISNAYVCGFNGQVTEITTAWKQNDYVTNTTDVYTLTHDFIENDTSPELILKNSIPKPSQSVLLESMSPSFEMNAVIQKIENKDSKKVEYFLKIWFSLDKNTPKRKVMNLSSFNKHGEIHADSVFGSLQWSQDGTRLVYVAERKKPKISGFFEQEIGDEDKDEKGQKFIYEESWGELLTEVTNPVICVVDTQQETVEVVTGIPENVSPAQPQWGPDGTIIFEGIKNQPYRLGRIYCENRSSAIYQINLKTGLLSELTSNLVTAVNYSPRVSLDSSKVVFLHNPLSGNGDPHQQHDQLVVYNFENKTLETIYDDNDNIPLYCHSLPIQCWLSDNNHVVLPNIYKGKTFSYIISINEKEIKSKLNCSQLFGVYNLKDNFHIILSSYMKLDSDRDVLQVTYMPNVENFKDLQTYVEENQSSKNKLVECGEITNDHDIISYYLLPGVTTSSNMYPLIVFPHGGPHSVFTDIYNKHASIFCQLGYAVLMLNYRGSLGFSKDSLMSLPGHVGKQDVQEIHDFTIKFLKLYAGRIDVSNIFVFGGSHGGFLGTHLIGQYPDFYRAAALRNPVVDIAAMLMVTDIPDWCFVESGLPFSQDYIPSSSTYESMIDKSPIKYASQIKAPLLLLIGEKDQRVPPSQGKGLYRLMKANKKTVKLLLYPNDSHPLSSVETEIDSIVNTCNWFFTHKKC